MKANTASVAHCGSMPGAPALSMPAADVHMCKLALPAQQTGRFSPVWHRSQPCARQHRTPAHQHTSTPCGQSSGAGPRAFKPYAGPRPSRPSRYGWQLAYRGRAAGSGPVAPPSAQSWAGWCVRRRRRRSAQPQAEASCAPGVAASRVNEGNYPGLIGLTPIGLPLPHAVCLRGLIWQGTVLMTCSSLDDRRRPAATSWRLARGRVA